MRRCAALADDTFKNRHLGEPEVTRVTNSSAFGSKIHFAEQALCVFTDLMTVRLRLHAKHMPECQHASCMFEQSKLHMATVCSATAGAKHKSK